MTKWNRTVEEWQDENGKGCYIKYSIDELGFENSLTISISDDGVRLICKNPNYDYFRMPTTKEVLRKLINDLKTANLKSKIYGIEVSER